MSVCCYVCADACMHKHISSITAHEPFFFLFLILLFLQAIDVRETY